MDESYYDIEDSMEKYYRQLIADDIDRSLYRPYSESNDEQTYWFNQGMRLASMIARYGST
jgi:hypothetical protein